MIEKIQADFELMGLTLAQLPEHIADSLSSATMLLSQTLVDGGKVIIVSDQNSSYPAALFEKELHTAT